MAEHKLRALVSGLTPFFFNKSKDNTIEGHTYPDEASTLDLGSATKPFRAIYADSLIGGSVLGGETVKVSAADPTAGYLEDKIAGVSPISLATSTDSLINISLNTSTLLLRDGSNSLTGNLPVGSGVTIDGVDIGNPLGTLVISSTRLGVNQASDFTWAGIHQFDDIPNINANLNFMGSSRSITAAGDLIIDPTGTLYYPLAQNIQGVGFQDLVSGIDGFRHHNPTGNTRQLTIGRIKADELYVRVFTADEERVNRGAEFWARSFGIVETTFTVPADESNVDVYFEEVPGLPGAKLFLPNNWILFRTVDVDTGLTVMTVWFQVVDAGANDYVSRADANESTGRLAYQVWRLKRKSGGTTGVEIKKGNVGVDFGLPADAAGTPLTGQYEGQGVVALSALSQDSGPYIQIQTFDTVTTDTPVFLNRVRMGNLDGILGYDRDADGELFGFAAGNNLALDPDAGSFKGVVIDQVNGLRMYNTEIKLFDGADDTVYLNPTLGLGFQLDASEFANDQLYISWYSDLADSLTYAAPIGRIGAWGDAVDGTFGLNSFGTDVSRIRLNAVGNSGAVDSTLIVSAGDSVISSFVEILSPVFRTRGTNVKTMIGATSTSDTPTSRLHVKDDTSDTGEAGGVIIEQSGSGDSMLHWYMGSISGQWFTAGIDQSDGGKWKLSANNFLDVAEYIVIDDSTGTVIINGLDLGGGTAITGLTSSDSSITIAGSDLVVNSAMYVPSTRTISAGTGLSGGGALSANRTLAVDFSAVVSTSVSVGSGAGLTGGGTLTTSRTLAVGAGLGITVNADDVQINFGYSPTWTGTHTFDQDIQANANLDFIGGNRQITSSHSITMAPTNDLTFTPGGDVILTTTKIFKSSDYATSSAGIVGFAFINNGASNKQLDINTIRADQLRAETFVADATRVDVGEEYWGKSMGIIDYDLTTPSSIGGTTFIYFEDSAALQDAPLFSNNDWILIKTVTAAGAINEFWGQVSSYSDHTTDANGKKYQRWTFTLRSGPTSTVIKSGNVAVGFGAAGQGYVHLTTLDSDNGPFIEIGKWGGSNPYDGVSDTTNVRMGNLNGAAGIATNEWGFATGNNLALTPSTGFSGVVSSATDGVLIYNSDLIIYNSGVEVTSLTQSLGLTLTLADSLTHGDGSGQPSTINWINADDHSAWISSGLGTSTHTIMDIATFNNDSLGTSEIRISSYGHGGDIIGFPLLSNSHSNIRISSEDEGYIFLGAMKTITHGSLSVGLPVSPDVQGTLTVPSTAEATLYVNAATAGAGYFDTNYPGVLINRGELRFEVAGSTFVTVGIDDADGDKFKISYADDFSTAFITFNPTTGVTTISGLDGTAALDGVTAGTGITIAGAEIAVNSSVVRTTREVNTGYGLSGGGDLSSNLSLTIDTGVVVVNTRTLTAGNGLTGGGDLSADRTFNVGAGSGITVNADDVAINLAATSGLNLTSGLALDDSVAGAGLVIASKVLAVGAGSGITVNANDVAISLAVTSGLNLTSGLALDDSVAGAGLVIASKVLAVGAGNGITVNANDIALASSTAGAGLTYTTGVLAVGAGSGITVNANDVQINLGTNSGLNITSGLVIDSSVAGAGMTMTSGVLNVIALSTGGMTVNANDIQIKLPTNSGLVTDSTGLYVGTPTTLTYATTNSVTTSTHAHAITTSSNVSAGVQSILASTVAGGLTLKTLSVAGNVDITGGGDLTVGTNILFVDTSQSNVGFGRSPDPQFTVDVNGPLRADWLIGKHAIQLDGALLLAHFDGGDPNNTNFTGESNAHRGQVGTVMNGTIFRPGKFGKAVQFGNAGTNLCVNPSFETNTTSWSVVNGGTWTRISTDSAYGDYCVQGVVSSTNHAYVYSLSGQTPGTVIIVSAWLKVVSAGGACRFYASDSAYGNASYSTIVYDEDGWKRVSASYTVQADGVVRIVVSSTTSTCTLYVDAVQMEVGYLSPYMDGSLSEGPGLYSSGHTWSGTAHASSSSRVTAYMSYPKANNINGERGTIMFWVYVEANNATLNAEGIFDVGSAWPNFACYMSSGTAPIFIYGSGALFAQGPTASVGQWVHVGMTWDIYSGEAVVYTNGVAGTLKTNFPTTAPSMGSNIYLGHLQTLGGARTLNGYLDDFVILDRVADADEIMAVYQSDAPVFAESSVFNFRSTPLGLVWADSEGLWMRNATGGTVFGIYGGEAASKSWAGLTLASGDLVVGDSARGATMWWDDSAGTLVIGKTGASTSNLLLDGGSIKMRLNTTERLSLSSAGVLEIKDSGGAAVFTFNASAGAEFTKSLTLGTSGGIYQGSGTFASPTTGLKIFNSSGTGKISGYNSGTEQATFDTDGKIKAGAGKVLLDANGIQIVSDTATPLTAALRFTDGSSTLYSEIRSQTATNSNTLYLTVKDIASRGASIYLSADADTSKVATIQLQTLIDATPNATLSILTSNGAVQVSQPRAAGVLPVLSLSQTDSSEPMIDFLCTAGAGNGIDTAAVGAYAGKIKVVINGVTKYIPYYS